MASEKTISLYKISVIIIILILIIIIIIIITIITIILSNVYREVSKF